MDLKIISSTDRPNSMSFSVAKYVSGLYKNEGIDAEVISLEDFPTADVEGGQYGNSIPSVEAFRKPILEADAIVWVIPEYNGSFPGILKLFIDYLPFPEAFVKTPMAFIGIASGSFGGLRAVEQFQMVANYRNAQLYPERVFVQRVNSVFDPKNGLNIPLQQELLESKVTGFIEFVKNLNQPVV